MGEAPKVAGDERVCRRRYERERKARIEAERLLEQKSRDLWHANEALRRHTAELEASIGARTAELERARRTAEDANAAKSGFLAMISHEIRTPMNGILGMAAGLVESDLPEPQRDMAETLLNAGESLLVLLNDVLDLSKIEAGKMDVELRTFELQHWLDDLAVMFAAQADAKGLDFRLEVNCSARCLVRSDPTRLRQVLSNLLSNALKFTVEGGVYGRVWVSEDRLLLRVRDTGPGVSDALRPRLFQAFSQTDASVTRKFGGTGLGLTISRNICRLLGGDLTHVPVPEGGSSFEGWVRLSPARAEVAQARGSARTPEVDAVLRARAWRVLVAEDSETNVKVIRLMLTRFGLDITVVGDGAQAVASHCAQPFDIVLMDVNMPVMDGLEAAAMIRAFEAAHGRARVPIIALTANAMAHQVSDYLRQGIDVHVPKPYRLAEITSAMAGFLARRLDVEGG